MATQDFVPDANPETTSVDGVVEQDIIPGDTWANLRASAGSFANDSAASFGLLILSKATSNVWRAIDRNIITLDLSGFSGTANSVTAASFKIYAYQFSASAGTFFTDISLVSSAPASNIALVAGDFDSLGTVKYADDVDISSKAAGYYTFNLNSTGITAVKDAINGDGILKLGVRSKPDADNTAPTWQADTTDSVDFRSADFGSNKPTLTITYFPDITIQNPLMTINVGINAPTLSQSIEAGLATINIQMLSSTISITGANFTNQAKNNISPTNTSENSISPVNQTKNNSTIVNQSKT